MRGRLVVLLVFLAVAGFGSGVVAGGTVTSTQTAGVGLQEVSADDVVMEVQMRTDGSAHWRIEHRIRLDDENTTTGFATTQEEIQTSPEEYRGPFTERVRAMATRAETETGRTMVVQNVTVDAYREQIPQEYGVIVYEFTWYGFAETADKLRMGDTLSGLFLDEETTMLVSWPDDTTVVEVTPEPAERRESSLVWHGPVDFASGEPSVVLESESSSFGPDLGFDASSNDMPLTLGVFGILVVGIVGSITAVRRHAHAQQELESDEKEKDIEPPSDTEDEGSVPADETTSEAAPVETVAAQDSSQTDAADMTETAPADNELLSNEERVLALLDQEGGRIKQQEIVQSFDWSETKTSEVVSDLRETEQIEVYRLGRENVLALPDVGIGFESDDETGGEQS